MQREKIRQVERSADPSILDGRRSPAVRAVQQTNRDQHLELAARAELDAQAGRRVSDAEWAAAKLGLVAFARILRGWHQQASTDRRPRAEIIAFPETLLQAA